MKTASTTLKNFIPSTRSFFEADLITITPLNAGNVGGVFAADSFIRANQNPIVAPWIATEGLSSGQVLSNKYTSVGGNSAALYDGGIDWPSDQFSQATLAQLLPGTTTFGAGVVTLAVRDRGGSATLDDPNNGYFAYLDTNNGVGAQGGIGLPTTVALGSDMTFGAFVVSSIIPQIGDVFRLQAIGSEISLLRNGVVILSFMDTTHTVGRPGLGAGSNRGTDGDGAWKTWSGGGTARVARRLTTCDRDILWNGLTYTSGGPNITRGAMKWSLGLVVDTLDLSIDASPVLLQQLSAGIFDGARFQLDRLYGTKFGAWVDSVTLFSGNIADIKELGRTRCNLQVRSRLELLNNSFPRMLFQPSCRWSLYDAGCGLVKATFTTTYTVAAGSTPLTIKSNAAQANGYYDLGTITWLTGTNAGQSATVKGYLLSNGAFTLNTALPSAPVTGDTFAASAGCDKLKTTCQSRFANLINFAGFPYVPVPESAF